jgi:hypothetical protein
MAKIWHLDTETKGTGAHVAPLESKRPAREKELSLVTLERPPRPAPPAPEAPAPRTFKVVDVMGARVLAEGIGAQATVELLEQMGSVLDARIYVWMQSVGRWRLLTLDEQKALWQFRGQEAGEQLEAAIS